MIPGRKINKETMTPRERVMKAIRHEPVDRMPIDLGSYTATGISAFAYWNLREYLGLPQAEIEITDMVQFTPRMHEDILKRFHVDCVQLKPRWSGTHRWNPRGKYEFLIPDSAQPIMDGEGAWTVPFRGQKMRMPAGGFFFDGSWLSCEERDEDEVIRLTAMEAERLYKETDYFTMFRGFNAYFNGEDTDWLCRMLTDPEEVKAEQDRILQSQLRKAEKVIAAMGNYVQAVTMSADLGTQNAPIVNPAVYGELCAPYLKKFCSYIHENSGLKVFMHNCGSIKPLLPILIESGVDIMNPVQVSARDMDPQVLKSAFGDRLVFWGGGCDTQNVLNAGTPKDVADNVRKLTGIFKKNSGYVFNQVHNIMGDIKPENIVAMFDTAYEESFLRP